jgi:hypothetical protein
MFQSTVDIYVLNVDRVLKNSLPLETTPEKLQHDRQLETEDKTNGFWLYICIIIKSEFEPGALFLTCGNTMIWVATAQTESSRNRHDASRAFATRISQKKKNAQLAHCENPKNLVAKTLDFLCNLNPFAIVLPLA